MVVACLALFLAVGGSAVAAKKLLVGSGNIKRNAVSTKHVKPRSLLRSDFRTGQVPAGPAGQRGPEGSAGVSGRDGFGVVAYGFSDDELLEPTDSTSAEAPCEPGTVPIGGATRVYDTNATPDNFLDDTLIEDKTVTLSSQEGPIFDSAGSGWVGAASSTGSGGGGDNTNRVVSVVVTCANADTIIGKRKSVRGR